MVVRDAVLCIGSSNMAGFKAQMLEVGLFDMLRWIGPGDQPANRVGQHPFVATVPGVRMVTVRRPWAPAVVGTITSLAVDSVTIGGGATLTSQHKDSWLWIASNAGVERPIADTGVGHPPYAAATLDYTGGYVGALPNTVLSIKANATGQNQTRVVITDVQDGGGAGIHRITVDSDWLDAIADAGTIEFVGQPALLRRITNVVGQVATITPNWNPAPINNGTLKLLGDSHTLSGGQTASVLTKSSNTPVFGDVAGRFVMLLGQNPGSFNVTRKILSNGDHTLVLEDALGGVPSAGDGIQVLSGADACEGLDTMQPPNCVLRDLTISLDLDPSFDDGTLYGNYDATPWQGPRFENTYRAKRNIAKSGDVYYTATTLDYTGAFVGAQGGSTVYITSNQTGLFQLRYVASDVANAEEIGVHRITLTEPWAAPVLSGDGQIAFFYGQGPSVNCVFNLTWYLRSRIPTPFICAQVGISSSFISPFHIGDSARPAFTSWTYDIDSLDFHPSSPNGIFQAVVNTIDAATALAAAEGDSLKWHVFINLFDNDTSDFERLLRIGDNAVLLRDALRNHVNDPLMAWIMSGPSAYGGTNRQLVYDQLNAIKASDPASGVVDTRVGYTYAPDGVHLSAQGQIKLGHDYFFEWVTVIDRIANARRDELWGRTART